jgi:hypothetical protein
MFFEEPAQLFLKNIQKIDFFQNSILTILESKNSFWAKTMNFWANLETFLSMEIFS